MRTQMNIDRELLQPFGDAGNPLSSNERQRDDDLVDLAARDQIQQVLTASRPYGASAMTDDTPISGAEAIKAFVKTLPSAPGVYRMIDAAGEVLYVGKARSLKARVTN